MSRTLEEERARNREKAAKHRAKYPDENRARCSVAYYRNREQALEKMRAYYAANKERIRARTAAWYAANKERALARCREYVAAHREEYRVTKLAYYHQHPKDRPFARCAVARAVKAGTLRRPDGCEWCGGANVEAHHEDYSKPLEVLWLCRQCHRQADRDRRRRERSDNTEQVA